MDGNWLESVVAMRVHLAAVTACLAIAACPDEGASCRDAGADCMNATTTSGAPTPWDFGSDDNAESGEPIEAIVECVPKPEGACPDKDSACLSEVMEQRHDSLLCSACPLVYVFSAVLAEQDPQSENACCYVIEMVPPVECVAGG